MIGIHLHDVSGTEDHKAPTKGELDFMMFKPYINKDTLKVIEAHHPAEAGDLLDGKKYLETIYNGKL
jgi:hypothetical protein